MAAGNAEQRLQAAGWPVDKMPDAQRQVLNELSSDEVDTMIHVRQRLMGAGGEVEPYAMSDNGIFYY